MQRTLSLLRNGVVASVAETKARCEPIARDVLEPRQNKFWLHFPARNQPIAMLSLFYGEHVVGCDRFPKINVAERLQPLFNLFDILKNNHSNSLSQLCFATQFYLPKESTGW